MPQRHFEERLDELKQDLLDMSHKVERQMEASIQLASGSREEDPRAIIDRDQEIDQAEVAIEEKGIELLALHQPMAGDLRMIVTILKINNDLERIGDHAVNIAEAVIRLRSQSDRPPIPPQLEEMGHHARDMLRDGLDDFVQLSTERAAGLGVRDDKVDALHESLFRVVLTHMLDHDISACLQVILISRNVERIADHAVNIGEDVVFMVRGTTIRHRGGAGGGESGGAGREETGAATGEEAGGAGPGGGAGGSGEAGRSPGPTAEEG